jgi:[pyruvate, water dikinase]-phosphate phosphotransferase / [pyruvate, water dikinase] kinase
MSYHLYLLSDATGETVEHVVRAALSQFTGLDVKLHKFGNLRTRADVVSAVHGAASQPGLIIYTLVNAELTQLLRTEVANHGLEAVDLINPLIYKMSDLFAVSPQEEPGLLYQINAEYYKRVEAVNYTVKQDDGQELRNLCKADLVLVGVSRTSKTPLSMYLAHKGYKVANVPLVKGIDPPQELFQLDQKKVVGLLIDAQRLVELRSARLRILRQSPRTSYADYEEVEEELEACRHLFRRHPEWQVVDVTNKSVEESASDILRKLNNGLAR